MRSSKVESLWSHLHWLIVLSEQGSYTAAAKRLGVSKAAMSQHIAELEREVGLPLVRRTTRSMRLTEAGQRLVDDTGHAFAQIAESFHGAKDLAGEPRGLVRVTAPVALGRQQLVPRVAAFLLTHPAIRVEMELSDRFSSLATEGFDLAVRHTAAPPDTHVAWELCRTYSLLVASRAYLDRCGSPAAPQALTEHACLHYPRGKDSPVWSLEPKSGRTKAAQRITVPVGGPLAANNSEALRDAAMAGLGIALVPDFSAQAGLRSGELVEVLPDWRPVGTFAEKIFALRPYAQQVPRAVTLFVRHLERSMAAGFQA
ncbi:LysR family transcriptional regulator [Rhodoferax koreense]|uniref:LysR family transcriptional regulator n=1 Tax=Rhodoferax koreensis TaxID=1842727 RepID=A0A1P8K3G4_9BURK|nr:LysR family transcriptional regulator [Rhodoferax koreense]APW40550.1 LysR family transcriptional regulator [Rhodoferax koreense]